jgi:hypothetical protein
MRCGGRQECLRAAYPAAVVRLMSGPVVWWVDPSDGAAHAIPQAQVSRNLAVLTTVCQRQLYAHQVERHDDGLRCLACSLMVKCRS